MHRSSLLIGIGVVAIAAASCSSDKKLELGGSCTLNSDCTSPLLCKLGSCRKACVTSVDCDNGGRCVTVDGVAVCQTQAEAVCGANQTCAAGLTCRTVDNTCRSPCTAAGGCLLVDQTCTGGLCVNTSDLTGGPGNDGSVGAGGADGGTAAGGDAQRGADVPATGVDAPATDSGGSTGATGDAAVSSSAFDGLPNCGDAAVLSNGTCNYCFAGACPHGTCVNGANDFTCTCYGGFANTTPKTCTVTNACTMNIGNCTAPYVCENTQSPGAACRGQFSTTPLSDPAANVAPVLGSATQYPTYSDNGDGTVTDQVSGLIWQVNVPDPTTGCAAPSPDAGADASAPAECNMADAMAYCTGLKLAGHSDWRLPTKGELESLLWCNKAQPPYIANIFVNTPSAPFWTSSIEEKRNSNGWFVSFHTGDAIHCGSYQTALTTSSVGYGNWTYGTTARCVRGTGTTANTPAVHYTINPGTTVSDAGTDGGTASSVETVTDNWTGLTWQRQIAANAFGYAKAGTYCAQLGNGFRLPTTKELFSLIDPTAYSPAIDGNAFPNTPSAVFWASTPVYASSSLYCVNFDEGATSIQDSYNGSADGPMANVRCVK